ncbi:hypothetical protein BgiMline_026276 [Biomphalaria glabrata]|uniref:Uncharacterized protein LOC106074875 n=1 Tax=Biomphalaria glabrata TaxID=6526 RepID=A0A9U8EK98_BIOGL|nr:uncharacterized protein LOC106074875 [Biomphalaria glabrata]XP_055860300.1 uncharacterized protein LOC106074875 [Biomphalaria glabrata]KAI8743766.1 hypothetical protein BgiMline_020763 [Biomphalaria glabrata]
MANKRSTRYLQASVLFIWIIAQANGGETSGPLLPTVPPPTDDENTLVQVAVVDQTRANRNLKARFNKQDADQFHQCMCRPDHEGCRVKVNGTIVDKNKGNFTGEMNPSYICQAKNDTNIGCDGFSPAPGVPPPSFKMIGEECTPREVSIYWHESQQADVSVKQGYASSMFSCANEKCGYFLDRKEDISNHPLVIALVVVCISLFLITSVVILICLVKTKRLKFGKRATTEDSRVSETEHSVKGMSNEKCESVSTVCSGKCVDPNGGKGYDNMGYQTWPSTSKLGAPDYEFEPPSYDSVFQPGEKKQGAPAECGLQPNYIQYKRNKDRAIVELSF